MRDCYKIQFVKSFKKDLHSLHQDMVPVIMEKILQLEKEPRPSQSKKLRGSKDKYRLRVGNYRIFFTINDKENLITIYHVAHRREAYR
jgi:mRNA interferase RelE/StbE